MEVSLLPCTSVHDSAYALWKTLDKEGSGEGGNETKKEKEMEGTEIEKEQEKEGAEI